MNEGQNIPYLKLINKKEKVVIITQSVSRLSPIHHQRGIHLYNMNYYSIFKKLQLLHKLLPREFQVTLENLSVLKLSLVEIETYPPIRLILCK